ncbi:hypothetical protein N0V93_004645 [Gnomoniopsis smithogilvyi]|uniref:Uncharacterized protein n=1 Tax=Gnomoniopsis smithogilvyi TaxID=1191159 RepID=A0A9W8YV27_9PEZI|nr:hypothetical protein N0V93_004645 [Gnomoniopsis smithogilvyi]
MVPQDLEKILRKYDVSIDSSALQSVWEDEEQGRLLSEWAKTHSTSDTLLTKEELNLYLSLERNGRAQDLVESTELSTVQAFSDEEIKKAIEELRQSTEVINKQTEALRQQQDALSRLLSTSGKFGDARSGLEVRRLHKWESDRKALNTTVELLSQSLDYRLAELQQQTKSSSDGVTKLIDDMLHSDDKLLSSLQKLGWELDTEDPEETESVTKLRDICARLIKYTVECIRTKLDRVYLETLQTFPASGADDHAAKEDIEAQQEELEELYSEILPVAQMSVEQQWLEPSLKTLSFKNGSSLSRSAEALGYTLDCLDYLLDRTDLALNRVLTLKSHETAAAALLATAKHEVSTPVTSSTSHPHTTSSRPKSLITDTMMTPAPSRTAPPSNRRRSSFSTPYDAPLDHLSDSLALSLPSSSPTVHLRHTLHDRLQTLANITRTTQSTLEHTAAAHIADARIAIQLVRDSVLAESPFAEVHLVDPGIESSIGVLGQEVGKLSVRLDGVEREARVVGQGRNVRREEMVARWGGRG